MIINNNDYEDMKKIESSSESEEEYEDEQDQPHRIENKGDKFSNNLDFYAWDRHKKNHIHWIFNDDEIRKTPYSGASSNPSENNVRATEWNTMSASQILSKSMPEGKFGKLDNMDKYKNKQKWQAVD